ncbi:hypothetical protein SBOR_7084 [Sclerotinia borealis F-4128]|uniref:2EXR domain-containing protein n=1 Tax=Sclerotinia borealis (strain F-4128) TaxID=1432307 RepID=W9C9T2_SCLBF|nr:hypothetical protein SBOR_7084 [Sclerotinia borealis F-4128]
MQQHQRDEMSLHLPPKKRICLDLNHYSIPGVAAVKINKSLLSSTAILESLPNIVDQQGPIQYVATQKCEHPLNHFYIFRWLPKELQIHIWSTAATDIVAQIITISSENQHSQPRQQTNQYHQGSAYIHNQPIILTARYVVPHMLHVCQNAREVALKYYRPVFAREIGGAPIYMTIDDHRTPDTIFFSDLTALQMLRSRTQNFRIMKNDMDFIKSAIVCTNIHKNPRKNSQNLRWLTSSLREIDTLWIAKEKPCTCDTSRIRLPMMLNHTQYLWAHIMISQRATVQQRKNLAGFHMDVEAVRCVQDPSYCATKWGFRVPEAKIVSIHQLKAMAGLVVGRSPQSRVTLEYLHDS